MTQRPQALFLTVSSLAVFGCGADSTVPDPDADTGTDIGASDSGSADAATSDVAFDAADLGTHDADATVDVAPDIEPDLEQDTGPDAVEPEPLEWVDAEHCGVESCDLGQCDPIWGTCRCPSGTFFNGNSCMLLQRDVPEECIITTAAISPIAANEALTLRSAGPFEIAVMQQLTQLEPEEWAAESVVQLARFEGSRVRVLAQPLDPRCEDYRFNRIFDVRATYPSAAGEPGSDAVGADSASLVAWASVVENYAPGAGVLEEWRESSQALGPAEGNSFDIVSMGEGGTLTLGFDEPIADGLGPDFVLFENSFSDTFLEFAFIEVSSDGVTFVRFDSASQTRDSVGQFGGVNPEHIGALGGRYRQGWGTPFDLGALRQRREVVTGELELASIRYVRILDVVGDGSMSDSFGRPIYDPTPTMESTGFDVDGLGVINVAGAE